MAAARRPDPAGKHPALTITPLDKLDEPSSLTLLGGLVAGPLKLGMAQASELFRTLLKSERPSGLARAIVEAGRINKAVYLLTH